MDLIDLHIEQFFKSSWHTIKSIIQQEFKVTPCIVHYDKNSILHRHTKEICIYKTSITNGIEHPFDSTSNSSKHSVSKKMSN